MLHSAWNSLTVTNLADTVFRRQVGFSGKTALHCACADGRQGAVATLLATGKVDPNEPDKLGRTPMHLAALHGHAGAVAELLRASHKSVGAPPPPPGPTGHRDARLQLYKHYCRDHLSTLHRIING